MITNPLRLERFHSSDRAPGTPAIVLVPTRISVRKGLEDVAPLARLLLAARSARASACHRRPEHVVGLHQAARRPPRGEHRIARSHSQRGNADGASAQATWCSCRASTTRARCRCSRRLASGVPVIATSEVGSIEGIDRSVAAEVEPGDVEGMADAIEQMLERLRTAPGPDARAGARGGRAEVRRRRRVRADLRCPGGSGRYATAGRSCRQPAVRSARPRRRLALLTGPRPAIRRMTRTPRSAASEAGQGAADRAATRAGAWASARPAGRRPRSRASR